MPRVNNAINKKNHDLESTHNLVPTLSHIYRTHIPFFSIKYLFYFSLYHRTNKRKTTRVYFPSIRCRFLFFFLSPTLKKNKNTTNPSFTFLLAPRFQILIPFLSPSISPSISSPSLRSIRSFLRS